LGVLLGIKSSVIIGLAILLGTRAPAQASEALSHDSFCSLNRETFITEFSKPANRLGFDNPAGKLDMGVCWWDSMFQRSAVYLTVFRPDLPRGTFSETSRLIHEIIKMQNVVEIPGYSDLLSFSTDYSTEISRQLSDWQLEDGFIKQSWILDLLLGNDTTRASVLGQKMDQIYTEFSQNSFIPFVRLKLGRVVSHALLIIDIAPLSGARGYQMQVIDSNLPRATETVTYHYGDLSLALPEDDISEFVPTEGKDSDFQSISKAINTYCAGEEAF
jgi:hypothetical protein